MAQKVITTTLSDLSGEEITLPAQPVTLTLNGTSVQLDLTVAEEQTLVDLLTPYLSAGRRITMGRAKNTRRQTTPGVDTKAVRAWAQQHGITVPERGRIPRAVVEQYRAGISGIKDADPTPAYPDGENVSQIHTTEAGTGKSARRGRKAQQQDEESTV